MNGTKLIWIALGLIVLATVLFLYFGANPENEAAESATQVATTTEQVADRAAVRAQAVTELSALRARQEAGESYESLRSSFEGVRARLAASYATAEGAAKEEWAEISAEFDQVEADARTGTSTSLDALARLIAKLSVDVRTETEAE